MKWGRLHLDGNNRLLDIKNLISEEFEVTPKKAEEDLCEFVSQLSEIDAIYHME
jgi:hypothetical protein